jgi:hypothetical protein
VGDSGLARAGKPGKPDHYASVSIYLLHMSPFQRISKLSGPARARRMVTS